MACKEASSEPCTEDAPRAKGTCRVHTAGPLAWFVENVFMGAEVVMIAPDESARPHIPTWIGCHIPVVPLSLCATPASALSDPVASSFSFPDANDTTPPQAPTWFSDTDRVGKDGFVQLTSSPKVAADCLELLESGTSIRGMQPPDKAINADGTVMHGVTDDDALRMVIFPSLHEAQRRAVLLLLLTYDPFLGARLCPSVCFKIASFKIMGQRGACVVDVSSNQGTAAVGLTPSMHGCLTTNRSTKVQGPWEAAHQPADVQVLASHNVCQALN
jgi:hypothetical protein